MNPLVFLFWSVIAIVVIFIPPMLWGDATLDLEQDGYDSRLKGWFCLLTCFICIGIGAIGLYDACIYLFFAG